MKPPPKRPSSLGVIPYKEESWYDKALAKVQSELPPEFAKKVVAISFNTGEYVVGDDYREARDAFRVKFPKHGAYIVRADGSPVMRVPWV